MLSCLRHGGEVAVLPADVEGLQRLLLHLRSGRWAVLVDARPTKLSAVAQLAAWAVHGRHPIPLQLSDAHRSGDHRTPAGLQF